MKIMIFGTGVIGLVYGYILSKAGNEVTHYVRPGKKDNLVKGITVNLLDVRTKKKSIEIRDSYPIQTIEDLPNFDAYDLVIVSVRHYQLESVLPLLSQKLGKADILFFGNLWTDFNMIDQYIPRDQYLWGFPVAGGSFDANRSLLNGVLFDQIRLGEIDGKDTKRIQLITKMFHTANITVDLQKNIQHWLWVHFAMIAGLNIATVRSGGSRNFINSIPNIRLGILYAREAIDVCKSRGIDVKSFKEATPFYLPSWLAAFLIWLTLKINKPTRKSMELYDGGEELHRMFLDVLQTGNSLNLQLNYLNEMKQFIESVSVVF